MEINNRWRQGVSKKSKTTLQGSTPTGGSSGGGRFERDGRSNVVSFRPRAKSAGGQGSGSARLGGAVRKREQFQAREVAGLRAAALIKKMRKSANMTPAELAGALGMASVGRLCDIEAQRVKQDPSGEWRHVKVPLDLLYEIAGVTGCELRLSVERIGGLR